MAFYNPSYSTNYNPYQAYGPIPNYSPPQPDNGMIWVQGESGAKAYPVQSGKSVVLFDSETERFFIKTTDASGIPQPLRIFSYSETNEIEPKEPKIDTSNFITREEFNEAINSIKNRQQQQQNNRDRKDGNKNGKPTV